MSNAGKKILLISAAAISAASLIFTASVFAQEEIEYKKFKFEDFSCDAGVSCKKTQQGLAVAISAIATGKGTEFRKWSITGIKLRIGEQRLKPDKEGKFYVTEESLFRVPGAVVFAAIGALGDYSRNDFNNTVSKVGVALGMGLIALQAKGEITGERCVFYLPAEFTKKIDEGKDYIEIIIENENLHLKETIKIGLVKPVFDTVKKYNFDTMNEDQILERMDSLKTEIVLLEQEQSGYKYGKDSEYDLIQKKIENAETQRGIAYKAWFERSHRPDK